MNHEHMNVKNEVEQTGPEQTGPKKPWVTPRLDDLDCEDTDNAPSGRGFDGPGSYATISS